MLFCVKLMTRIHKIQVVRNVFNTIYRVISTAVITLGVVLGALYLCGIRLYHVKTGSMGELLPVGSACFVSTYSKFENTETGDVISFRVSDDMLVTHRAIAVTEEGIITKGDENDSPDPDLVTKDNYIGKTVFALPHAGRILGYFHSLSGMIVLAAFGLLLLLSGALYKRNEDKRS